ncbi:MAG: ATP synthase subunit I [Lachnoclostridium sp.]|nr:ATP synthase subunit I [Lachnospira sp.]MCM1248481.1 ATP synthase subunit I [Lachnoclostridium sp.]MCM1536495.1 ATP synthase subunit I [Clostridium sp.]
MKVVETLKKANRTLLEMWTGILLLGLICQAAGMFLVEDRILYTESLWFGILLAFTSTIHMYRSLDRALDFDEKTATKLIFRGYLIRYAMLAVILALIAATGVLNFLVVLMAYMSLKVTALIQPITHKVYNKLFHEEDPVPLPMEEQTEN